ncbi:MAG: class I SAM-dependent methyltransferase, partial [Myxococcota bacterium]
VYLAAPAEMEQSARVSCSCCGGQLPKFVPGGVRLRPNARCPLCGSLERHRLLGLFLQERLSSVNRLLHIAPETCLRPMIDTFVAETVRGDLDPGHDQVRVDITAIEYPDGHFDAVLCNHVLEHVPDDTRAMSELFRVLSPGGWAVLQVPIDHTRNTTYEDPTITSPEERALAFGQHDHVRWYGLDSADRLRSAGFKVHSLDFAAAVGLETVEQFGLDSSETLFFCTKE